METPFKRQRDKGKRRAPYWFRYVDEFGIRRMKKGFTDKGETERYQAKLQHEADLRRRGLIDAGAEAVVAKKRSLTSEHLAAFEESIKDNTPKYVSLAMTRIRAVIDGCSFETLADIESDRLRTFLRELVEKKELALRTRNHYLQAFQEFCSWLVETERIQRNPILGVKAVNSDVAIRHKRRALTPDEFAKLVRAAEQSTEEIQCFDGKTRAIIYWTTYATGLRRNEIGSLTPESYNLKSNPATVTVEAAFSKHRKKDILPLHPDYAAMMRAWLADAKPHTAIFPKLGKRRTYVMVQKDLKAAGIPYKTQEGVADFHAAGRHTHITELLRNGASLPEARALARHSDIRTTMKYTHLGLEDQAKAVQRLPWIHNGSSPYVSNGPAVTTCGNANEQKERSEHEVTTSAKGTSDASSHDLSLSGNSEEEDFVRVRFPPPPLSLETSPSASTSKGFLIVGQRVPSTRVQFDRMISRILRFAA